MKAQEMAQGYNGHNLVFLVGSPRSGTTWLQRLLASHPKIHTGPESYVVSQYAGMQLRTWKRHANPAFGAIGLPCYLREQEFQAIVKNYLADLLAPMVGRLREGEVFLEKTPQHSVFAPEILQLLPEARFIHILRDARDVVASLLATSRSWGWYWASGNVKHVAGMWAKYVSDMRGKGKELPAWQYHEVRYEELLKSPREVLRGCADFLGLPWEERALMETIEANRFERVAAGGARRFARCREAKEKTNRSGRLET